MPRHNALERGEAAICKRLREFRLWLHIPRSAFAVAAKVSGAALANCELGRSPLRWELFWKIHCEFLVNIRWLVTGDGDRRLSARIDVGVFRGRMPDRDLLSDVWDGIYKGRFHEREEDLRASFYGPAGVVEKLEEIKRYLLDTKNRTLQSSVWLAEMNAKLDLYSFEFSEALGADGTFERLYVLQIYGTNAPPLSPLKSRKKQRS